MYDGDDPDGLVPRDELVACFDDYVERIRLPARCGVRVIAVEKNTGYRAHTSIP